MSTQRWIYILVIVLGVVLGLAIAGVPSQHSDPPLRLITTTTAPVSTPLSR